MAEKSEKTFARPAYTQQLQYDLSQSMRFNYRSMNIEVLSARNDSINFIVWSGPEQGEIVNPEDTVQSKVGTGAKYDK